MWRAALVRGRASCGVGVICMMHPMFLVSADCGGAVPTGNQIEGFLIITLI